MTPERWSEAAIHSDTHPYCPLFRGRPMTPMAAPWRKADRPPSRAPWRPDFWLLDAPPLLGRRANAAQAADAPQATRPSDRPARLSRHRRPAAICAARPGRKMPTLARPSTRPGGRRLAHLYCPGSPRPSGPWPHGRKPTRPPQAGRRRSEVLHGEFALAAWKGPRRGGAVVSGPRLSFRPGPVPPGRMRLADPAFPLVRTTRTPRCCKRARPVSAALVFDNRGDTLLFGRPYRSRRRTSVAGGSYRMTPCILCLFRPSIPPPARRARSNQREFSRLQRERFSTAFVPWPH